MWWSLEYERHGVGDAQVSSLCENDIFLATFVAHFRSGFGAELSGINVTKSVIFAWVVNRDGLG
jgi:hypothetical protein